MEAESDLFKKCAKMNDEFQLKELLNKGFDPNQENGWPLRLAARFGSFSVVKMLLQYGANPHLLGEAGASALQLAVYSDLHWQTDKWGFLLSCHDSSQLADAAAVAIVFKNFPALNKILQTGRCNTHIPTTLTGKTLEQLAKGYKLDHLLTSNIVRNINAEIAQEINQETRSARSPRQTTNVLINPTARSPVASTSPRNQLSPSVATFFHQASRQSALTPPRPRSPNTHLSQFFMP